MQLLLLSPLFFSPPPSTPTEFASLFFLFSLIRNTLVLFPQGVNVEKMFVIFSLTCNDLPQKIQDESVCDMKD